MAKQVEDIVVRLVGEGFEALDKIKGSFRELGKVTNLAEKDILSARDSLLDFAKKAGNTEAVNRGLIDAFKGLRSQVSTTGATYRNLTTEIAQLETAQRGSTAAIDQQRTALLSSAAAGKQNAAAIEQQIQGLTRLQQQTRPGSSAFLQLGKDIDTARVNLGRFKSEAAAFSATLTQIPGASLDTVGRQIGRLTQGMQTLKIASDAYLSTQQRISLLGEVRGRTTGRQQVRGANQMFESLQFQSFAASRAGNLELPETLAGIQQRVGEINTELQNVSGYTRRRSLTIELADLNRQLKSSIVDVVTQENLAVDAVRRRVNASRGVNQASGFGAFSAQAGGGQFDPAITTSIRRARERLERENDRLRAAAAEAIQISRTPLLLPAAGQTTAAGTGQVISGGANVTPGTRASRTVRDSKTVRMLGYGPDQAAGVERFFSSTEPGMSASSRPIGPAATSFQAAQYRPEYIAQRDALKATAGAARATEQQMQRLRAAVDTATKANTGSATSLGRLREALVNLRNEIPGTAQEFRQLNQQVEGVDRRSERMQTRRRRPSTGQLVQAGGAAISGGIFGGPEGFLGGVAGGVVGSVLPGIGTAGGAFAGAAGGAQLGMFRQQLAGTADYAASIGKLQIALRGVVGSQSAYDAAIRAAAEATRDLNIPQEEATRGLTRLSAAVIGAGGTVADSSFAFRAMSEAIKATGGNAEQVDGALLALTQVFSKGKVSAEELNQIAERLPGTFTLFAQATGKTGPELQKALEQGKVGLNDLMKFLALTGERYGTIALDISSSSKDAGARLTVAFQAMRLEVGKALQPLGAELQGAFAKFIKDITPAVVGSAKAIAAALTFFTDNKAAGGLATFALQMGAVALAIKGLQGAFAGVVAMNFASVFTGIASKVVVTGSGAAAATPQVLTFGAALRGLLGVAKSLLALGVITLTVDVIINNFKRLATVREEIARLRGGNVVGPAGPMPDVEKAAYRFAGASRETVAAAQKKQQEYVARLRKDLKELEVKAGAAAAVSALSGQGRQTSTILSDERTLAALRIKSAEEVLDLNLQNFKTQADIEKARQAAATNFPGSGGEDASTRAADKAKRDAGVAAAEQQRLNEAIAKARIALADAVFRNDMDLIRKRYEYEQELEGKKRDLAVRSKTGGARESATLISSYFGELQTLTNSLSEAGRVVDMATQDLKSAKATAATTVGSPVTGGTSSAQTAQGYISKEQLRTYLISQGMGRTSGDFTNAGHKTPNHTLNAMDMGFTSPKYDSNYVAKTVEMERKLRSTGAFGSQLYGPERDPGGHRDHLHVPTPGGKVPLTPGLASLMGIGTAAAGRQATGVASAVRRDVAAEGGVSTAEANLNKALAAQALIAQRVKDLSAVAGKSFVIDYTAAIREQNAALTDAASITKLRNNLQLAGERPETIDAEVRKAEVLHRSNQLIADAKTELEGLDTTTTKGAERATVLRDAIAAQNTEIAKFKELTDAATAAQIAFNDALLTRQDDRIGLGMQEGVNSYIQSIGTMREATEQLTVNGIKGVENAIFDLVTTGKTNFREFAADILRQTARMIIQQLVMRSVLLLVKAAFKFADGGVVAPNLQPTVVPYGYAKGGTFANNIVPYAKGGAFTNSVVTKPTLFKFANGGTTRTGLMGEAGPEAIMPLSRGANGKLGVSSNGGDGGTTNVTVNVDASGSKAQGDSAKSEQLGRAVSQAVQDELLKQRRPGGLLA